MHPAILLQHHRLDIAGNNMNVSTRTLIVVALAVSIPLAGLVIWSSQSESDEAINTAAAPPLQAAIQPQRAPEPLARELQESKEPEEPEASEELEPPENPNAQALQSMSAQLADALELLKQQSELLQAQSTKLDDQAEALQTHSERMQSLETAFDDLQGKVTLAETGIDVIGDQERDTSVEPIDVTGERTDVTGDQPTETEISSEAVSATETSEDDKEKKNQEDDPTRVILNSLPGAMRLPGTNIVMKWGGYVKSSLIKSFDPLAVDDRFITGAIPVQSQSGFEEETTLNVTQSRLNVDMREPTRVGLLRAFVEGDFDGNGETFRLRHAFGQRGNVLAGKTWSGFVDRSASPEEIDFEGLNGRINVRQAQFRFQPGFGEKYEMAVSLEDPNPRVTGGSGVSQVPDLVVSGRLNLQNRIHSRLALLLRQVRAQPDDDPDDVAKEFGYALQWSGRMDVPWLDDRDNIVFQLTGGKGFGRYVNDLNSVGDFDGVFNADNDLELIDVLSGYVSAQHWWRSNLRSNLTFGFVQLDNPSFVDDDFYKTTTRFSGNLMWSPNSRFDLGAELLWGRRENEDGEDGTASQFQFATRYLF